MEKTYDFLEKHKWLLWSVLIVTSALGIWFCMHCRLEEDIFKLLPKAENEKSSLVFNHNKLKDKVMVQAVRAEGVDKDSVDNETLSLAMDLFMETALEADSATNTLQSALYEVDPMLLLEAGTYLMEHGAAYLDFTEEEMDELTAEDHIREQLQFYMEMLETETGQNFYDVIAYDPCGISMKNLNLDMLMEADPEESAFQYNHLFAGKGETCIGFLTPTIGPNDSKTAIKMLRHFDAATDSVRAQYPGIEILYHGTVVMAGYNSLRIRKDIFTTVGVALAIIFLLLAILLKRPKYMLLMLLPIAYGAVLSLAGIYLARGWMSMMALGLGVIVLGVALSYCLHVLIHYVYTGDVRETVREQSLPVFLGAITTIGAFAGLIWTKSSLLQDFGAFALLTIVGTTFISLLAMPHFFPKKNTPNKKMFRLLERMNETRIDKSLPVCLLVWIFVGVCICFSGKYEFDSNLRHINYVTPATQRSIDIWAENQNQGLSQQYFASMAETLDEALEQLPEIEVTEDSLYEAGIIRKPLKMSAIMPSISKQEERIEHWQEYFTIQKQQEVWQHVVRACQLEGIDADMFEPFRNAMAEPAEAELIAETGLIPDEILGNFIEENGGMVLVYFSVKADADQMLAAKDALTKDDLSMVLDPYYYSTNLVELVRTDFNKIMLVSSIFVLILLLVTYRNVWLALIAFLPMSLSWYTVLGAMAIFHQPFNLINIVVSSFIFGIGVDYSIFIMDGLLKGDESKAMVYHKTAITLSAFVLILCMFSLLFAVHPALNSIAFASIVGMVTTMMLSYSTQPRLYRFYEKMKSRKAQNKKA
ncbi:MAG: MMPL family transporter [Bacteroidales bacterium]|nr:MMPL family transporter [Candidatus Colicola faecequi]